MKNMYEIMKEFGLEIPEDKKKDFDKAVLDNYKTVSDYEKQTEKLRVASETIKANDTAFTDLKKQLEGFKDVDVTDLNQRITELETEKKNLESDYNTKLSNSDFNDIIREGITSVNGKNVKAITALLDTETLKVSKIENLKNCEHYKESFCQNASCNQYFKTGDSEYLFISVKKRHHLLPIMDKLHHK